MRLSCYAAPVLRILGLIAAIVLLASACGDDADGGDVASIQVFCERAAAIADADEDFPEPEVMRELIDSAPPEIAEDVELVGELFIEAAEAEDASEAFGDAVAAGQTPEFRESVEAIEDFSRQECGIETEAGSDGADGNGDAATNVEEYDFDFAGVPGRTVAAAAGVELVGHSFRGGVVSDGVDSLRLFVDGLTEQQALDVCRRVAEHVADHPEVSGEGELSIGSGPETDQEDVVIAETTVGPGDAGDCRIA